MTLLFAPSYMKSFTCLASDCPESCCRGWDITVDEDTYEKYLSSSDKLLKDIKRKTYYKEDSLVMILEKGNCPFLDENGLCRIYSSFGFNMIPETCRNHPFFRTFLERGYEECASISCEAALKLLEKSSFRDYLNENPESYEERELFILNERNSLLKFIDSLDSSVREITDITALKAICIQDRYDKRFYSIETDEENIINFYNIVSDAGFFREYLLFMKELEINNPSWNDVLNECLSSLDYLKSQNIKADETDYFKRLLYYNIFRYMMSAALDDDITEKLFLSILFSVTPLLMGVLSYSHGIHELTRMFSREMEYNEYNMTQMKEFIMKKAEDF